MQKVDIRKKRTPRWPWLMGVIALGLIVYGVTTLLRAEPEDEPAVAVPTVQDTHPPTAIPEPPHEPRGGAGARPIGELLPLDPEDAGVTVRVEGVVVATGNDAFWVEAGGSVFRIDSGRHARKGDTVVVAGTVRTADPELTDRIRSAIDRHPRADRWTVIRTLKVVETPVAPGEATGRAPTET